MLRIHIGRVYFLGRDLRKEKKGYYFFNTHSHCVFLRNFAKNMTCKVLINFCSFRAYGVYKNYSLPRALPLGYVFLGFQPMIFSCFNPLPLSGIQGENIRAHYSSPVLGEVSVGRRG